jgi:hypothetical protein
MGDAGPGRLGADIGRELFLLVAKARAADVIRGRRCGPLRRYRDLVHA